MSGFVVKPRDLVRRAVKAQIPSLPIEHFDRIAAMYNSERDQPGEPGKKIRESVERIGTKASALWVELGSLSHEEIVALADAAKSAGRPDLLNEAEHVLQMLSAITRTAHDTVTTLLGRPGGARSAMVRRLAALLEGIGVPADATPTGELVFLTSSVLDGYGETHSNIPKLVRDALNETSNN